MTMSVTCVLIAAVIHLIIFYVPLKIYRYLTRHYEFFAKHNIRFLPPRFPKGSEYDHSDMIASEWNNYVEYNKFYGRFDGSMPVLTIGERELIDRVMRLDYTKFLNRRDTRLGHKVFDNTLFSLEDGDWKRVRNIVTTGFSDTNVKMMMTLLEDCCSNLTKKIDEDIGNEGIFRCGNEFSLFVLHTIARCAFGVTIQDEDPFIQKSNQLFTNNWKNHYIVSYPWLMKLFRISLLNADTMKFYSQVMSEVVEERKKLKDNNCNDFLQRMLEYVHKDKNNNDEEAAGLSHTEMLAQCVTFFLAGYDSTTTLLTQFTYRLAMDQDCQKRVLEEIKTFLPKEKQEKECERNEAMYSCLKDMKYTESVIMECLRMCPPLIRIERRVSEDNTFLNGVELKKDFLISIPAHAIHHDPEYYEDPESFNPERFFMTDRSQFKNIYFPFGDGPRTCVAKKFVWMQVKICLLTVVLNYHILPAPSTPEKLRIYEVRNVGKVEDVEVLFRRRTQV